MPSVQTDYQGRLPRPAAQERLARRICFIGAAVAPGLDARARAVDVTLPWPVLIRVPDTEGEFAEIGEVRILGAELSLTDFRRDWHRFPFTFIRCIGRDHLALPDMTSRLVMIEDREECRCYVSPRIQSAQWYLASYAGQHLRYDLEPEFDLLMAYIRHFFMPDLEYWRYRSLGHYTEYRRWVAELRALPPKDRSVQDAIDRWIARAKWSAITEWSRPGQDQANREQLEGERSVEAIATGVLIDLLRRAHSERLD